MNPVILRSKRRAAKRGAAMVEGAFMALIMCLLWNLMVYCAGMYLAKLESVYVAKYATFWYSAHDCGKAPINAGMPPAYGVSAFQPVVTLNPDGATDVDNQNSGGNNCPSNNQNNGGGATDCGQVRGDGFGQQSFFSKGHVDTQFTWSWQRPPWWSTALSGTGKVGSDSYVMCNEGPYGINVFKFMGNVISQAVGAAKGGS
jgi:hypothetical protein